MKVYFFSAEHEEKDGRSVMHGLIERETGIETAEDFTAVTQHIASNFASKPDREKIHLIALNLV